MTEESQDKPRIIVDDDWKARAQAEKETLQEQAKAQQSQAGGKSGQEQAMPPLPPASITLLITTLATQAMASLGEEPDPGEGKPAVRLELAKHCIEMLAVLEEKTQGNLTSQEQAMLGQVLHELRLFYVAVEKQPPPAENEDSPIARS